MTGFRKLIAALTVFSFLLFSTGVCLAVLLPDVEEGESNVTADLLSAAEARDLFVMESVHAGEPLSGPEEMKRVALSKARSWIPEVSSLEEYERGAAGQTFFMLSTAEGGSAGWIHIDACGNLLSLCDFTRGAAFTDVNLDKEQAEAAAKVALAGLGFERDSLEIISSGLRSTGATGPLDATKATWEYVIEFKPRLNGIFVDDADYLQIRLNPTDGSILGLNVVRSQLRLVEAPAQVRLSEEEAVGLALRKAEEENEELEFTVKEDGFEDSEGIRLRYVLPVRSPNEHPLLCWRITLEFQRAGDTMGFGGGQYEVIVDALTGEVFLYSMAFYG